MRHPLKIWRDPANRLSWLRVFTLVGLCFPFAKTLWYWDDIAHGARPIDNLIHRAGFWTIIFVLTALAVTPLRRIARLNQIVDVRRMIGVGAFVYGIAHFSLFIVDQKFDLLKVATEIVSRIYLTIGFVALLGLATLAVTSTNGMVRRMGSKRWQRLHQAIYVIGGLALIHFFQQNKSDVAVPTFAAGLFGLMLGYRLIVRLRNTREEPPTWMLLALAFGVAALTFICEAIGLGIVFHVSPWRVLQTATNFELDMIRPGWLVLGVGLLIAALDALRSRYGKPRRTPVRPGPLAPKKSAA